MAAPEADVIAGAESPTLAAGAPLARLESTFNDAQISAATVQPVTLIGGRRDCHLSLPHPEVSKIHCAVVNTGTSVVICDLGSRSGTFVNGAAVQVAALMPGSTLRVGSVNVDIHFDVPPQPCDPAAPAFEPPAVLTGKEAQFTVSRAVTVIGRRSTCECVVDDPDVSLAHALLFSLDGALAMCDLGSRSGTMVNGESKTLEWLRDGDCLRVGQHEFTVSGTGIERVEPAVEPALPEAAVPVSTPPPTAAGFTDVTIPAAGFSGGLSDLQHAVAALQARVTDLRTDLRNHGGELDAQQTLLDKREQKITDGQAVLAWEQKLLKQREQSLSERERAVEERMSKAEQFKQALKDATQAFGAFGGTQAPPDQPAS